MVHKNGHFPGTATIKPSADDTVTVEDLKVVGGIVLTLTGGLALAGDFYNATDYRRKQPTMRETIFNTLVFSAGLVVLQMV